MAIGMKAGKLEINLECCLCSSKIDEIKYAIRDSKEEETYSSWLYRHIKSVLTFGASRPNPKTFLPVCDECIDRIEKKNY